MRLRLVRPRGQAWFGLAWSPRFHTWLVRLLVALLVCVSAVLFITVPLAYMNQRLRGVAEPFAYHAYEQLQWVESAWREAPLVPPDVRGDGGLRAWLEKDPLLVALVSTEDRAAWRRDREGWRKSVFEDLPPAWQRWFHAARGQGERTWNPPGGAQEAAIVVKGERWMALRRWTIGSAEVEAFLRRTLGPQPIIRVGLRQSEVSARPKEKPDAPWCQPPHLQAAFTQEKPSMMDPNSGRGHFGPDWQLAAIPGPAFEATLATLFRQSRNEALGLLLLIAGLWAVAWQLHRRARARERAMRDRLASLTHSLKTPLAILKLRCDDLRLRTMSPEARDGALIRVSEDVDRLATLIDQSLKAFRESGPPQAKERLDRAWMDQVVADLAPAFSLEGRELDVALGDLDLQAPPSSLRLALVTLLENALVHGRGAVRFEGHKRFRGMRFTVANETSPWDLSAAAQLGSPFYRVRSPGHEGFKQPGHGLGLFLLSQLAHQEGWGLQLRLAPESFVAVLDLP